MSGSYLLPAAAVLACRAATHIPDLPGYGRSPAWGQERVLRTPVPTLVVIGTRDPLMPPPWRVREVGRLAPPHLTIAVIKGAAHAMNVSHPGGLAHVIGSWLDGREIIDDPDQPGVARVVQLRRDDR